MIHTNDVLSWISRYVPRKLEVQCEMRSVPCQYLVSTQYLVGNETQQLQQQLYFSQKQLPENIARALCDN